MENNLKWYDVILANWSQIAVIITAFGFVIQKFTDWTLRKKEITFSRLQENRILEIKAFYKSYLALELALRRYVFQTQFGDHNQEILGEIKREIAMRFFEFDYNCLTVKLFLHTGDIPIVDEISSILESIRRDVGRWHIYKNSPNTPADLNGVLENITETRLPKRLPALIKKLETTLRKSYNLV